MPQCVVGAHGTARAVTVADNSMNHCLGRRLVIYPTSLDTTNYRHGTRRCIGNGLAIVFQGLGMIAREANHQWHTLRHVPRPLPHSLVRGILRGQAQVLLYEAELCRRSLKQLGIVYQRLLAFSSFTSCASQRDLHLKR